MRGGRILLGVLGAVGALLILFALLLWFVRASLDSLVQSAIETHGSQLAGARVRVDDVDLSLGSGEGTLRGLRIENPEGFSRKDAIRFDEIRLRIDVRTLREGPVVIEEIRIDAPYVNYEVKPPGKSNIDVIRANLDRHRPAAAETAEAEGEEPAPQIAVPGPRFVVREFVFENGQVEADARALGGKQFDAELLPLRLENVGGKAGAPADEIGKTLLVAFTRSVGKSLASESLGKLLEEKLGSAGGVAQDALKKLTE